MTRNILLALWLSISIAGCATDPTAVVIAAATQDTEDEPNPPSRPSVTGWQELVEPCTFDFGLESSAGDFVVVDYRLADGGMPPGYSIAVVRGENLAADAKARLKGPPVSAGRWTASFVAADIFGNESEAREISFICNPHP
jgi:hypothetical protein